MLKKYWFNIVFLISIIAISSALVAEIFFYLEPCRMCLKQREPYYAIILVFLIFTIFKLKNKFWFYGFIQIISIYGLFYSIWHVGIENNILEGPSECSAGLEISNDVSSLKEQIITKTVISCDEIIWSIFGLSAATINSLLLILIFIINIIYLKNEYSSQKKENG